MGRGEPNAIRLDAPTVSRAGHAQLDLQSAAEVTYLDPLGRNDVYVDGAQLHQTVPLPTGTVLRFGDVVAVFRQWRETLALRGIEVGAEISVPRAEAEQVLLSAAREKGDLPILITGPTGVGKELLARLYHEATPRRGDLVAVDCASIAKHLLNSELFGHVKGAFSGAEQDKRGLLLEADGGTLFLDEVADLPVQQQSALLRTLQERQVRPVGANQTVAFEAALISATSRDVDVLAKQGKIRGDFLARILGIRVNLPGLRFRREEILPLFRTFLDNDRLSLTTDIAERVLLYDWPLNVRELKRVAGIVQVFSGQFVDGVIDAAVLPAEIVGTKATYSTVQRCPAELDQVLRQHAGNVSGVAEALGVSRATIHRWCQKAGLNIKDYKKR